VGRRSNKTHRWLPIVTALRHRFDRRQRIEPREGEHGENQEGLTMKPDRLARVAFVVCSLAVVVLACSMLSAMAAENEPANIGQRYFDCLAMWSEEYIVTQATPSQIADIAQSKCEEQMAGYEDAFRDYLMSTSPTGDVGMAAQRAKESAQYVRRLAREHILKAIIDTRLHSK